MKVQGKCQECGKRDAICGFHASIELNDRGLVFDSNGEMGGISGLKLLCHPCLDELLKKFVNLSLDLARRPKPLNLSRDLPPRGNR